ncbi:MAG: hypothetical protein WCQ47_08455 [bacterium]
MNNKNNFKPKEHFVALFDVLGFRNMLKQSANPRNSKEMLENLSYSYKEVFIKTWHERKNNNFPKPRLLFFSDTIFSCYVCDEKDKFEYYIKYLSDVMSYFLACGLQKDEWGNIVVDFPLRGALSFGDIVLFNEFDKAEPGEYINSPLIMGVPIVDAYDWERDQKWLGVSVVPQKRSCLKETYDPSLLIENHYLVEYDVPKEKGTEKTLVLNYISTDNIDSVRRYITSQIGRYEEMPDINKKYLETLKFVEYVHNHKYYLVKEA